MTINDNPVILIEPPYRLTCLITTEIEYDLTKNTDARTCTIIQGSDERTLTIANGQTVVLSSPLFNPGFYTAKAEISNTGSNHLIGEVEFQILDRLDNSVTVPLILAPVSTRFQSSARLNTDNHFFAFSRG